MKEVLPMRLFEGMKIHFGIGLGCVAVVLLGVGGAGCGMIADKDRITVAEMDGEEITRGDLFELIRSMDDEDRPMIRNKNDLLRILNNYIDREIKIPLGQAMEEEGKIRVPWEMALQQYFQQLGEEERQTQQQIWRMPVPEGGETTPLMEVYNLTPERLERMKEIIAQEVDRIHERLLGDEALAYLALDALRRGTFNVDQDALQREYELNKQNLVKFEWMRFIGLRFPTSESDAQEKAAQVRERVEAGDSFDAILDEYVEKDAAKVFESEIENNPDNERFRGFWQSASGAEAGEIIGPTYLPEYTQMTQTSDGRMSEREMPDSYVVLKVLEHEPERVKTLEEAQAQIVPQLLVAQKMEELRDEHGVEIYEENLPDPAQFVDTTQDPLANF